MSLGTRIQFEGTVTANKVVPIYVENSALIQVVGSDFSADLSSLIIRRAEGSNDAPSETIGDYEALGGSGTTLTPSAKYKQTIGGGNYALVFTSGTGSIKVLVTEGQ